MTFFSFYVFKGTEMVGPSYRKVTGLAMKISYSVGLVTLASTASLLRHWRHLELVISIPMVFFWITYRYFHLFCSLLLHCNRYTYAIDIIMYEYTAVNLILLWQIFTLYFETGICNRYPPSPTQFMMF